MKFVNLPAAAARNAETGLVWTEIYNGSAGVTFQCLPQQTIRVSAGADITVTIDGVLSMTLRSGEVERLNVGSGLEGNQRAKVHVVIGAGDVRVQVAQETDTNARRNQ